MDRQKFCSYWYIYKMDNFMTKLKSTVQASSSV